MSGFGGDSDGPPPILVLTLSADPRGPTNEWLCNLGPDEGKKYLNGPWGGSVSTPEIAGVLAKIARQGYSLQSSLSIGLSSVTGHDSEPGNVSRRPPDKFGGGNLVRSTTAYNNVIQHIFQLKDEEKHVKPTEQDKANSTQLAGLHALQQQHDSRQQQLEREANEQRGERQRLEDEVKDLRLSLEHERQERMNLRSSLERERQERMEALAEKDRELASLRRGMMAGAGAFAASIAQEEQPSYRQVRPALHDREPLLEEECQMAPSAFENTEPDSSTAEGVSRAHSADTETQDLSDMQAQQQAELARLAHRPSFDTHTGERQGSSGGPIVESDMLMEGSLWRDLGQVLAEPMPQNVYCTPMKRHQKVPVSAAARFPLYGRESAASPRTCARAGPSKLPGDELSRTAPARSLLAEENSARHSSLKPSRLQQPAPSVQQGRFHSNPASVGHRGGHVARVL